MPRPFQNRKEMKARYYICARRSALKGISESPKFSDHQRNVKLHAAANCCVYTGIMAR